MFDWFKKSSEESNRNRESKPRPEEAAPFRPGKLPLRRSEQPNPPILRLKIQLFPKWAAQNNPDGPATFCRQASSNAFQVSWAEYSGGKPPNVTTEGLKQMASDFGQRNGFRKMAEASSGPCIFGSFGTAVFRSATYPRIQVWFISDGRDHIMATHICDCEPEPDEINEIQQIAASLALGP